MCLLFTSKELTELTAIFSYKYLGEPHRHLHKAKVQGSMEVFSVLKNSPSKSVLNPGEMCVLCAHHYFKPI